MLNKILEISLGNRFLILIASAILMIVGIFTVSSMEVDVFPDLSAPTVTVLTEAHGMEAIEVERLVTFPIETGLNGSPDLRRIRSSSAAGISIVWAEFDWGTDIYRARQIISEKLQTLEGLLPPDAGEPTLAPVSSIMGEVMLVGLNSDSLNPMELRTLADWEVLPRLKSINGVANVIVMGGEYRQYQVLASPLKMNYFGVSVNELAEAAKNANYNASGGFFSEFGNNYVIRGEGRLHNIEDLKEALVKMKGELPVRIRDVAEVRIGPAEKIGDASLNARPSVILTITKQPTINTLLLTKKIDQTLEELRLSLQGKLEINSHIFRQADFIEGSINNLKSTLLEGALFVVVVLFLFLMNWRTTFISLLAIPLSLLVSVIILKVMGYSLNTMSLGGMAIAIGALVDDAIIDVENVFKRLRENVMKPEYERKPTLEVIYEASREVRSSIIIATFIVIISFIPLFFLSGMEGRLLFPLGIAFISSVMTSLLVAVTLTPVLCSFLLKKESMLLRQSAGTLLERFLQGLYRRSLEAVMHIRGLTIGISIGLFGLAIVLFLQLGGNFLPEFNEGSLVISVVGPAGMSLEESNRSGHDVEKLLLEMPEIEVVARRTGRAELDEHAQGLNASELDVPFQLSGRSRDEFLEAVREVLSSVPGVGITIGQPISHRIDHMLSGTRANIAVKIFGDDLEKLFSFGKVVESSISAIPGLVDISIEQQVEVPQVRIRPRRMMLARYGLTMKDLADFVDMAFAGEKVSRVYEGQSSFDLIIRNDTTARGSREKMKAALVDLPSGGKIALGEIADVLSMSSPHTINRENVKRKVVVSANVAGRDLRGAVEEIQSTVRNVLNLPRGYHVEYGGQFESAESASRLLLWTSLGAIFLIFLLLFYEFSDLKLAGVVLINLPLALIGGVLIVYLSGGVISIASIIGFISLFGVATRNGILLVSRFQDLEAEGFSGSELVIRGAVDRLNAILMTALCTALALVPLALKGGEPGNEIQSPMAVVILGGLLTATLLNLFVIPCVYSLMGRRNQVTPPE